MGKQIFNIKGMMRDLDPAKSPNQYAYEIRNLRLTAQEDSTLLALTTEKGNTQYTLTGGGIAGNIVGYCVLNKYITIFTHDTSTDHIYRLEEDTTATSPTMTVTSLYSGDLDFDNDTKIEALGVYENENIQKVYWIDGVHQPRFINIKATSYHSFDFTPTMSLGESVSITKTNILGLFPAGTIQYVLCYFNSHGQISNPFYISDLHYLAPAGKGASPEDSVNNAFSISVSDIDTNWDNIRLYSIIRTSENGTPIGKKVVDVKINSGETTKTLIDNGMIGETIDSTEILMLTQSALIPKTFSQKSNTLFLGNIKDTGFFVETSALDNTYITFSSAGTDNIPIGESGTIYAYNNQLSYGAKEIMGFKYGETYHFGIIVQNIYGQWSNVIPIGSSTVNTKIQFGTSYFNPIKPQFIFDSDGIAFLKQYPRFKFVILDTYPTVWAQGVLCPTVFDKSRFDNGTYAFSSWFFRTVNGSNVAHLPQNIHHVNIRNYKTYADRGKGEVFGASYSWKVYDSLSSETEFENCDFFVDWNLVTVHSPDIEFATNNMNYDSMRIVGYLPITSSRTNMKISLASPVDSNASQWYDDWFNYTPITHYNTDTLGYEMDLSLYAFKDRVKGYPVYPWHASRSLTNEERPTSGDWTAELGTKVMSTLRQSYKPTWVNGPSYTIGKMDVYQDDNNLIRLNNSKLYSGFGDMIRNSVDWPIYDSQNTHNDSNDPIRIKYKSSKHGVVSLGKNGSNLDIIPPNITIPTVSQQTQFNLRSFQPSGNSIPLLPSEAYIRTMTGRDNIIDMVITESDFESHWTKHADAGSNYFTTSNSVYQSLTIGHFLAVVSSLDRTNGDSRTAAIYYIYDTNSPGLKGVRDMQYAFQNYYSGLHLPTTTSSSGNWLSNDNGYVYYTSESAVEGVVLCNYTEDFEISTFVTYVTRGSAGSYISKYSSSLTPSWQSAGSMTEFSNYRATAVWLNPLKNLGVSQETLSISTSYKYMYLVELYASSTQNPVITETSIWKPASLSIPSSLFPSNSVSYVINHSNAGKPFLGDTYYQRYDCLKTYPYSLEDPNQIVEILSFMCETRVNIDGRYDSRRGQEDNTTVLDTNFNLINKAYTQEDNFFNYHYLEAANYSIDDFPNQIMWTKTKVYGSDIDAWTQIVPTSTLDMDGTLGEIKALKLWNDNLMCFQDRGIAKIMYNERTTVSTQQGVPVEIANSGKVDGSQYISNQIGCSNKDSIQVTQDGIYFIDSNTKEIYRWSKGLESLSKSKGFNTYLYNNSNLDTEKTFYDPKLKDVYFEFGSECLVYNEQLAEFTSFLDYDMKFMFPFKDSLVAIKNNTLWEQFAGNYLSFFGSNKGYSVEIISAEKPTEDKIFSIVEFRADVLDNDNHLAARSDAGTGTGQSDFASYNKLPFDSIRAWNEYQDTGHYDNVNSVWVDVALQSMIRRGANMSQKFRIWRADIPRVYGKPLERIRNPWARIKLSDAGGNKKTVIHDIGVTYF